MTPREHRLILARLDALMETDDPAVALDLIRHDRLDLSSIIRDSRGRLSPHLAGAALECVMSRGESRKRLGAFFTPPWLVEHVIAESLGRSIQDVSPERPIRVCDPSCGSGNFLIGVLNFLSARGLPKDEVIAESLFGVDINPFATELCREVLISHADNPDHVRKALDTNIKTGDAIRGTWPHRVQHASGLDWIQEFRVAFADGGFDVVVGNPPYLNQLETSTAESRKNAKILRESSHGLISRYADLSAAFLLLSECITRPGGRFAIVLPQSVISGHDVAPIRKHIASTCSLEHFWLAAEHVFSASVYTCVICAQREPVRTHRVTRRSRSTLVEHPVEEISADSLSGFPTWSSLAADLVGVPRVHVRSTETFAACVEATADFRDEYYALKGAIIEAPANHTAPMLKILTTGLIEPGSHLWGNQEARIHNERYLQPSVNRERLPSETWVFNWIEKRLVPKVIVASQTKVIECVDDQFGEYLPITPLISVMPRGSVSTTSIAAALSSPVASAIALNRYGCGALHTDSIKLSASQLLTLPLPSNPDAWTRSTALYPGFATSFENAIRFGIAMLDAYEVHPSEREAVMKWWLGRLGFANLESTVQ